MAIRTLVTRGYGNGTFNGSIALAATRGYTFAEGVEGGIIITVPMTIFVVSKQTAAAPGADQVIFDARSDAGNQIKLFSDESNDDKWSFDAGTGEIALSEAYDTDAHLFTIEYNGDATTKLTVSGVGDVTGDAGAEDWDFGSMFMNIAGAETSIGSVLEFVIFDYKLNVEEIAAMQAYYVDRFAL